MYSLIVLEAKSVWCQCPQNHSPLEGAREPHPYAWLLVAPSSLGFLPCNCIPLTLTLGRLLSLCHLWSQCQVSSPIKALVIGFRTILIQYGLVLT